MDDWMRAAIAAQAGEDTPEVSLEKVYDMARKEALAFMKRLIDLGEPFHEAGHSQEASAMVFMGVWQAVGMAKKGVDMSLKKYGPDSPVVKMWTLLEAVLQAGSEEDAVAAGQKWRKENGL